VRGSIEMGHFVLYPLGDLRCSIRKGPPNMELLQKQLIPNTFLYSILSKGF
jgi:hypothetical protein